MTGNKLNRQIHNPKVTAEYGCIVSFVNEHGDELTLHRTGPLTAGLRDACDTALALDPTYRVLCYSTPQTIFDDLQGRVAREHGARQWDGSQQRHSFGPVRPEQAALGRVRLAHLLHPSIHYEGSH